MITKQRGGLVIKEQPGITVIELGPEHWISPEERLSAYFENYSQHGTLEQQLFALAIYEALRKKETITICPGTAFYERYKALPEDIKQLVPIKVKEKCIN